MENLNNIKQCSTLSPQTILLKDIESVCHRIIVGCERNQVDKVNDLVDQLSDWLNQIDEKDATNSGKQEAVQMIDIMQLINQASRIVVSTGFSMIFR
jgi:hypothetical protein